MSTPTAPKTPVPAPAPATPSANGKPADKPADSLTTDFIASGAFMLPAELSTATAPVRARNEQQRAMDTQVKGLYTKWQQNGKPTTWDAAVKAGVVATYFIAPDKAPAFKKLITRAVAFTAGTRVRWGTQFKVTEKHVTAFKLPADYLGREAISFCIAAKRERASS